jgi:hypothetical protein
VVRDRGRVALPRVPPPVQVRLLARRREGPEAPEPDEPRGLGELRRSEPGEAVAERGEPEEEVALDVQVAGDVGAPEPELTGRGEDPADRVGERITKVVGASGGPSELPS